MEQLIGALEEGDAHHLEEALQASINAQELLDLGIPARSLPKVYGRLPRLYHHKTPAVSRIKEGFRYLPALKRQFIDKALLHLYASYSIPADKPVVLFTWVIGDGWGDYFAQVEAAKILRRHFPSLSLHLVTLVHEGARLPFTESSFSQTCVPYRTIARGAWENVVEEKFPPDVLALLQGAALVLQLPTHYPHTPQLLPFLKGKYELIGEGGWIDTPHFHPHTGARCLGLHFLEKGIFIKEVVPRARVAFAHRFNLAYTLYPSGLYLYMHTLLKSLERDTQGIDLYFFHLAHVLQDFERYRALFRKYGIAEVVLFHSLGRTKISISASGKELHLYEINRLPHEDYLSLVAQTQDLVGCRGDGSIFEAISAKKVFFMDIPPHQKKFLKSLIVLAEEALPSHPETVRYLKLFLSLPQLQKKEEGEWVEEQEPVPLLSLEELGEALGELLQSPRLIEGFEILNREIRENHAFNPFLCHIVQRALCHHAHPQLEILESHALDGYLHGDKSATAALQEIRNFFCGGVS